MHEVERHGISETMERILTQINPNNDRPIHLSLDIDGCDPTVAPGTGTRARGGLNYRESHYVCGRLAETGQLCSMDLVEINPTIDLIDGVEGSETSATSSLSGSPVKQSSMMDMHGDHPMIKPGTTDTVRLGIELVGSALGSRLL